MKYTLITRPQEENDNLAKLLADQGFEVISEPMLEIKFLSKLTAKTQYNLYILTSNNALKNFSIYHTDRESEIIVIGPKSALLATQLGYKNIKIAGNSAHSLVKFIKNNYQGNNCKILYCRGDHITLDIKQQLNELNYEIDELICYHACEVIDFSNKLLEAIQNDKLKNAIFLSVRTAENFVKIARKAGLKLNFSNVYALVFSKKIAKALNQLNFKQIIITNKPSLEEILLNLKKISQEL